MTLTVGQRLRELRERTGVSQRELARKSGQSPGSISAIELDKVSPSVETLKRLLDCLGETLGDFFSIGSAAVPTPFFAPADMIEVRLGHIRYRQLDQSFERDGLQLTSATVQPGSDTGVVTHQVYDQEIGFVLSGEIEVTINGETRTLPGGEGYVVRGGQTIRIRNVSGAECDYVFFSSPSAFRSIMSAAPATAKRVAGRQK